LRWECSKCHKEWTVAMVLDLTCYCVDVDVCGTAVNKLDQLPEHLGIVLPDGNSQAARSGSGLLFGLLPTGARLTGRCCRLGFMDVLQYQLVENPTIMEKEITYNL
jgi:hypothetical protein